MVKLRLLVSFGAKPSLQQNCWQVGNIERGVWEGMDCVQARP